MNASLFDRARTERFAQLLDEANGGRRHHARSRLDAELAELVATSQQLRAMPISEKASPRPAFRAELRAQLVATAVREGIGSTAEPEPKPGRLAAAPRARGRGAIIVGIAAGTLALSGVSVASGEAIPGDALYGMKRSTERAQLALAGSDLTRGQLHLDFAHTRLLEAYQLRGDEESFLTSLRDMDSETQLGIRMLIGSAVARHDTTALDTVDAFLTGQRTLLATMLQVSPGAGREKVTESLSLLSVVEQRSLTTRSALACGASISGSDSLGPVLATCSVAAGNGARAALGLNAATPEAAPATGPAASGPTAVPQDLMPSAAATPEAEEKKDDGLLGDLGRILGGLLGG